MTGASILLTRDAPPKESFNQIIAWVPPSEAMDGEAARVRIVALVGDALDRGFKAVGLANALTYRRRTAVAKTVFGDQALHRAEFTFTAPPCDERGVHCTIRIAVASEVPSISAPPEALGIGAGYAFGSSANAGIALEVLDTRELVHKKLARFPFVEALQEASRELPDWVYLYAAPQNASVFDPRQGKPVFLRAPVILHRGQVYPFIRGHAAPVPAQS
ncbi:hypothetical protein [Pseudoroseomonas sp. WGS1072]|uniref:hypothetical protein n=1 Tax=Roseomonas sp. WGS1072 TaxID=3366816 RepID=UPI003BF2AA98